MILPESTMHRLLTVLILSLALVQAFNETSDDNSIAEDQLKGIEGTFNCTKEKPHKVSVCLNGDCRYKECVNEEDYVEAIYAYIYPRPYEWFIIAMHCVVFIIGLVGNALICLAVYRNHTMRTVTNYFIVNLAIADLLVIVICLPPTVLWDVTETWFLGALACKIVVYFQVREFYFIFLTVVCSFLTVVLVHNFKYYTN